MSTLTTCIGTVTSKDGTQIAFRRIGEGPPIICVDGAFGHLAFNPEPDRLSTLLAPNFTVYTYSRRGRPPSGDTLPYAVEREIEDIEALIAEAGGEAYLYGMSSGAVLALEAAASGLAVTRLALYEPPFIVDDSRPPAPADYVPHLEKLIAADQRDAAVAYFMTTTGMPEEFLGPMRQSPMWPIMESVAHTLVYDGLVMGDTMLGNPLPAGRWSGAVMPTLVIVGGANEPWWHRGNAALVELLPNAKSYVLEGQTHDVSPDALAPVLTEFFGG